jgi:CheY-like chemotaxis protein
MNQIEDHKNSATLKGLDIILEIKNTVPKTLYTDEFRLNQILINLISNAIKYSTYGIIKLLVDYDDIEFGVKFSVIDSGNGIKKCEINNLFKQYCQTSCSDKFDSNGLGLYISQNIANLLGGYISVTSEYSKGSVFTLFHPISLENSGIKKEVSILSNKFTSLEKLSCLILIVDDNESNLNLLRLMLQHINYTYKSNIEIHSVKDGKDAIDICKINKYSYIFMDINMPGIDGATASKIIKLNHFNGKIIATTGNILAKKENSIYSDNYDRYVYFDDIIIKPYDDTAILKVLVKYND